MSENVDLNACLMFASDIFGLFNEASFKNVFFVPLRFPQRRLLFNASSFFESEADETEAYILPQRLTFY